MNTPDDEFDDFLRRRKPLFDRSGDDDALEPPPELDRMVLRQAREAIEVPRPQRMYRAPRWTAPFAVAATLAVAFTVVLQLMPRHEPARQPATDVSLEKAARRVDAPVEAPVVAADGAMTAAEPDGGAVIVQLDPPAPAAPPPAGGFVSDEEAQRHAEPPPAPILAGRNRAAGASDARARVEMSTAPVASAAVEPPPEYRRDPTTWLAEIERLRASGDVARADAERAEYERQHRAYAVAPDR